MAARETDLLLDVRWSEDLGINHDLGKIAAEAADRTESKIPNLAPEFVPTTSREFVRNILCEDTHCVQASRSYCCVVCALEVEFAPEAIWKTSVAGGGIA
jgi:hypothetical protein